MQARLQIELLRAELDRDLWSLARRLIPFVVAVPLIGLGYVFSSVAAALGIASLLRPESQWLGPALGTAIVGLLNLAVGSGITWLASREMKNPSRTPQTTWSSDDE